MKLLRLMGCVLLALMAGCSSEPISVKAGPFEITGTPQQITEWLIMGAMAILVLAAVFGVLCIIKPWRRYASRDSGDWHEGGELRR